MVHEQNIVNSLKKIDCTSTLFCLIAGISETRWSRAVRGIQPLGGAEIEHLVKVVQELTGLALDAEPLPLSFKNPAVVKSLLAERRGGRRWIPICVGPQETGDGGN